MTLEVPNMGQAEATGFMGSVSQSSPTASHTDDKAYKIAPSQAGGGRVPERELVESKQVRWQERRKGDGTSLATRHQKTRASKAEMPWPTEAGDRPFGKF